MKARRQLRKDLILSLSKDEVVATVFPTSWFDGLTMGSMMHRWRGSF